MKIAIIPARGGSKRIPHKNIIPFCGHPLIHYPLSTAKKTGLFDKIHVSTDDDVIKQTVEALGFEIDFMRDSKLADDYVGILPVLRWVLEEYKAHGENYDEVCLILPTAPLIESSDIINAHDLFLAHAKQYSVLPVAAYPVPVEWAYQKLEFNHLVPERPGMFNIRSQDLEKKYYDSGTFVWFSAQQIMSDAISGDANFIAYVLDRHKAIDIDDREDLEMARLIKIGLESKNEN